MSSNSLSDVTTTGTSSTSGITTGNNNSTNSTIQLDTMSLEQLNTIKQREESRLQALTQRYAALRQAAVRIIAAKNAVHDLYHNTTNAITTTITTTSNDSNSDDKNSTTTAIKTSTITTKDVFVPLTESVYVPGKIHIRNNVPNDDNDVDEDHDDALLLIELGTGYYMEQNSTRTIDFLDRKLNLVNANSDNVTQAIQATRQNMESITIAMRGKLIEIQARQQGQRTQQQQQEN